MNSPSHIWDLLLQYTIVRLLSLCVYVCVCQNYILFSGIDVASVNSVITMNDLFSLL